VNRKQKILVLIPVLCGLLLLGWAAQTGGGSSAKERWIRVMSTEMELAPRMNRIFQPRPYQYVDFVLGAGEFGQVTSGSLVRRVAPSGNINTLRADTSDEHFLIVSLGGVDHLGQWKIRVVHYIPWDRIVDIYFETSPVAGGVVR